MVESATLSEQQWTEAVDQLAAFDGAPEDFLSGLLHLQCGLVDARAGTLMRGRRPEELEVVAVTPLPGSGQGRFAPAQPDGPPPWVQAAVREAGPVLQSARTQAVPLPEDAAPAQLGPALQSNAAEPQTSAGSRLLLLYPLRDRAGVRGVVAFVIDAPPEGLTDPEARLAEAEAKLALSAALLGLYETRLTLDQRRADLRRLRGVCRVTAEAGAHEHFGAAANAWCDELASLVGAHRVSLGLIKGQYARLRAISGTERIGGRTELAQAIASAMEECADQDTELLHPEPEGAETVTRSSAELAQQWGPSAVLSLPIRRGEEVRGVVTVERDPRRPFDPSELENLRLAIELVGPRLLEMAERDRWIGARAAAGMRRGLATLVGPRYTWAKVAAIVVACLIGFTVFAEGTYRVKTPFTIEASEKRIISAPYQGYLESVSVEPGDRVTAGQTLGTLESSKLKLERAEAAAERQRYLKEAQLARREGKTAEAQVAAARAEEIDARLGLLDWRVERAALRAPVEGVVVAGDLKKKLGTPVEPGQTLFEVAPIQSLHAELAVSEGDIADLDVGQAGQLATASSPGVYLPFELKRIEPAAEVVEQNNVFRVRADLAERPNWLRPGMEGQAKVEIGPRSHAWIWTHKLVEWIRMKLWL